MGNTFSSAFSSKFSFFYANCYLCTAIQDVWNTLIFYTANEMIKTPFYVAAYISADGKANSAAQALHNEEKAEHSAWHNIIHHT